MVAISFQMNGGKKCFWQSPFCNSAGPEPLKNALRHKSPGAKQGAGRGERTVGDSYFAMCLSLNSLNERLILIIAIFFLPNRNVTT